MAAHDTPRFPSLGAGRDPRGSEYKALATEKLAKRGRSPEMLGAGFARVVADWGGVGHSGPRDSESNPICVRGWGAD
jgi:hypothetical protein